MILLRDSRGIGEGEEGGDEEGVGPIQKACWGAMVLHQGKPAEDITIAWQSISIELCPSLELLQHLSL